MPGRMKFAARGGRTRRNPGEMNRLEAEYAAHLDVRKNAGEIADYKFERFKLYLAKRCYITVDFAVMLPDGVIEFHETKGFMEDDAHVKLKVVAEEFWWFRFKLVKKQSKKAGGGFTITEIGE